MAEKINFYLAQYLRDPIRREPKNVGLFVGRNGEWAGRFLGGEKLDGDTDLRTIAWTEHPKIYRKWVRYWREELETGGDDFLARVMETNGGNFDVIHGGHVAQAGADTAAQIVANLFPLLVSEPASAVELSEPSEVSQREFKKDVTEQFKSLHILGGTRNSDEQNDLKNPVWSDTPIVGDIATHTPAYYQDGDVPHVMEIFNFTTTRKMPARDHAGWAATMFDDIVRKNSKIATVAIVNATKEDLADEKVDYSLKLLKRRSRDIVHWQNKDQREAFLDARQAAAYRNAG
ncbi:hypothetical protein [Anatilimnocola floriformis]|uniref:hypothetical protein n=1 Tax=Anatilimnocola floriformis TaxID=2948575 RepID=UPI0020C2DC31|nr:hypothetical protein [Anatilimnocola floriformis]